jgi:plastocyanin
MKTWNLLQFVGTAALAAGSFAACSGGDGGTSGSGTESTSDTTATTASTSSSSGMGGMGQGGDMSTSSMSSASEASSSSMSASVSASSSATGGPEVNGCTAAMATDLTNKQTVDMDEVSKWTFGHAACIIVNGGTQVTFKGDFDLHPLVGGVVPTNDPKSPFATAAAGPGTLTVSVPTDQGGEYPYFCSKHNSMKGVIYTK